MEEEEAVRLEERMREMIDLKEKTGIYMVCEESRVDWCDVVRLEEGKDGGRGPERKEDVQSCTQWNSRGSR